MSSTFLCPKFSPPFVNKMTLSTSWVVLSGSQRSFQRQYIDFFTIDCCGFSRCYLFHLLVLAFWRWCGFFSQWDLVTPFGKCLYRESENLKYRGWQRNNWISLIHYSIHFFLSYSLFLIQLCSIFIIPFQVCRNNSLFRMPKPEIFLIYFCFRSRIHYYSLFRFLAPPKRIF